MNLNNSLEIINDKIKEINLLLLTTLFKKICSKYDFINYEKYKCIDYIFSQREHIFYFENENQKIIFKYNRYNNNSSKIIINDKLFCYNNNNNYENDEIKLLKKFERVNIIFMNNEQEYTNYLNKKNIDEKLINQYIELLKEKEKYECEIINNVFHNFYNEKNELLLNKSYLCVNFKQESSINNNYEYDYSFILVDTINDDKLNINFYCFSNQCEGYYVFLNEKEYDELKITKSFKKHLLYNLYTKQEIIKTYENTKQLL